MQNKKIKILYVGPSHKSRGGISSVIKSYMRSPLMLEFSLLWIETQHDLNRFTKMWYFVKALLISPYFFLKSDIVHIHTASYNSFYRKCIFILLCKIFNRKLILHIHGGGFGTFLNNGNRLKKKGVMYLLKKADTLICLSPLKAKEIKPYVSEKKINIISNPCSFSTIMPQDKQNEDISILFAGWVKIEKGVFDLIYAFAEVEKKCRNCRLIIAGKGMIEEGREIVRKLGLEEKIIFTGWLQKKEMQKALTDADIFCLPSYCEGVPMSIIEAMAYCLPVLSTSVGGIPDIIDPDKTGFLVHPGNIGELTQKLLFLVRNDEVRTLAGKNAKAFIDEHCSTDIVSEQLTLLYQKLTGEG
jgi:glycosyltransferase involved in cell wall biosynthesis